jgi:glycosyltransferase involved in cell wall biosynthesis
VSIALVLTLLNEGESLGGLLESIDRQTIMPDEVVICDGGSTDDTVTILERWAAEAVMPVNIISRPGANISQGRNAAIEACDCDVICVTDGSCVLHRGWMARITEPFREGGEDCGLVFGRTIAEGDSPVGRQFAALHHVLTGRARITATERSSRSVAFRREVWRRAGGYPEWLTLAGEDTLFFLKAAKTTGCCDAGEAIVHWRHGAETLAGVYRMHRRNSIGSGEANMWPGRYLLLMGIYSVVIAGLVIGLAWSPSFLAVLPGLVLFVSRKLPALVRSGRATAVSFLLVPMIMLVRDLGMIAGYLAGLKNRVRRRLARRDRTVRIAAWSTLALLLALGAWLIAFHGGAIRDYSSFLLTRKTGDFTELYFTDYPSLPKILDPGREYEIGFTIVNHEGGARDYEYRAVIIEDEITNYMPVSEVRLAEGEEAQLAVRFTPTERFADVTVEIQLLGRDQLLRYRAVT